MLTLAGAEYAIRRPDDYARDMLPGAIERSSAGMGLSIRGQMIIGGLGSCAFLLLLRRWACLGRADDSGFFLLALISLSLFWTIKRTLPERPDLQQRLVKALLVPLAIADVSCLPLFV